MQNSIKETFEKVAQNNLWGDSDSLSGTGSNLLQTRVIREKIPEVIKKHGIVNFMDAPCGDFFWMKEIVPGLVNNNIQYTGADIVASIIEQNQAKYSGQSITFRQIDLIRDSIPCMDMILTRDCFIHLSFKNILKILENYKRSGSTYLLVSTYTKTERKNKDVNGFYIHGRALNLQKFPFYFPEPVELIIEECTEGNGAYADKSLGLWRLKDINCFRIRIYTLLFLPGMILRKGMGRVSRLIKRAINK